MLEEMKKMIAEQLSCDENEINLETSFKDDLGADSLDLFELVMALEDEYNIEIPAEELAESCYRRRCDRISEEQRHRSIIELNGCRVSGGGAKFPEAEMSQGIS